jgi:phospholipid/cholesterol/gamma-HCH transport system ATP-binding protein
MAIVIEGIKKSFGVNNVLKGIDFEFRDDTVNMIIGSSGSGKTVLVKCIVGLLKPDAGRILYAGEDINTLNEKELRNLRRQIGMLFQSSALFDSKTVFENVAFPLDMFTNLNRQQIRERVSFCLERVRLSHAVDQLPADLSGGMKKRAALARAIVLNPTYLICDEPNSGLDPETASIIDRLIAELTHEFKMTTIVVTHDMNSVLAIGEHVLYIDQGIKAWEGHGKDIVQVNDPRLKQFIQTRGVHLKD